MCHGQRYGWWNADQNWQGPRGPFGNQRGDFRNFRPFWFHGGPRWWNRPFNESVNFNEEKNQFEITLEVPGIAKDKIKVRANKEFLYVSIDNRQSEEDKIYERRYPFRLEADLTKLKAKYNNGLLTIEVPLLESEKQDIQVE